MKRVPSSPQRVAALLVLLTSCKVGPDYVPPEMDAPPAWSAELPGSWSTDQGIEGPWWMSLQDARLNELMARAFAASPRLASAAARIEEVRAQRGLRLAEIFPGFEATGSVRRFRNSANGINNNVSGFQFDIRTLYSLGLETNWEIDFWGKLRRGLEAATGDFEAGIEDWRDALVLLQAEVARAYVDLRLAQARIRISESNSVAQAKSLQLAEARFDAGLTSEADATRARTLLLQTEASIDSLATDAASARNRLAVLVGEFPGEIDTWLGNGGDLPEFPAELAVGLPHEMLRRRPDVRGAERRLAAQTARIGVAKSELLPSFSLNGSFGYDSASTGNLIESDSETFSIGPFVRWNVFAFGRVMRNIDTEKARTQRLLFDYEDVVLRAAEEVERALNGLANEGRRYQRLSSARIQSARSVEILRIEYEEGLADYQSVLDAERTHFQLEDDVAQARASNLSQFIALFESLGGGWQPPVVEQQIEAE